MIESNRIQPEKIKSIPTGVNCDLFNPIKYNIKESRSIFGLNDDEIQSFVDLAELLALDYLIEVHDLEELKRVEHFSNGMIGVNNRNLKTFDVDLNTTVGLIQYIKNDKL